MKMNIRDHFAGIALAGLIGKIPLQTFGIEEETLEYNNIAASAYKYADAMLLMRECNNVMR